MIVGLLAGLASSAAPISFSVGGMSLNLTAAQTVGSLTVAAPDLASSRFDMAYSHGSFALGDVSLRARLAPASSGTGTPYITLTTSRAPDVAPIDPPPQGELAAAHVPLRASSANSAAGLGLLLERHYATAADGGSLSLRFVLRNNGSSLVELGAFGPAMIFSTSNACNRTTLDSLAATCAMVDPSIASHHGFVSVTRMTGTGPVLLVVPENKTGFEAYRQMPEASGGAFYELSSLTAAYAAREWANSSEKQWVTPTAVKLSPGGSAVFRYRLLLADGVRGKDAALRKAGFGVLQAVPSCAIATDMQSAALHVAPPHGASISAVRVEPPTALLLGAPTPIGPAAGSKLPHGGSGGGGGFFSVAVRGLAPAAGRARVTVSYSDGSEHVANYFVMPPLDQHVRKYAAFMSTVAWYDNTTDPFARGHSVLAWNRERKQHIGVGPWDNGYEDNRIFNNGLSDEAGAGANVGLAAAVGGTADPAAAHRLDLYINDTLYGVKPGLPFGASLQCVEGAEDSEQGSCGPASVVGPTADGVMASMFWVPTSDSEPKMPGYDYNPLWFCKKDCPAGWPGWRWDQARGASLGRAYNYAHVSSTYLGMYQAAEYDGLATIRPQRWYLRRAYATIVAMSYQASWYSHQGLMDGTNFRTILEALQAEGMQAEATVVEEIMRKRAVTGVTNQCRFYVINNTVHDLTPPPNVTKPGCHWYAEENTTAPWVNQTGLPGAGSEFSWDTTGQEEAYVWGQYFKQGALAESALNQILAYTPLVPNFAWHGSAYGYGDFSNNGYIRFNGGSERVLQHYRSGLNAIPSTEAFLADPDDLYLLRLAAGSASGVLTNIDGDGAPSMAFHSDHSLLDFDPASGDHGLAFYGHSHITQSFVVDDKDKGWLCFFCDVSGGSGGSDGSDRSGGSSTPRPQAAAAVSSLTIEPRDSYRRKVFVAPLGLQVVSDAGTLARVTLALAADGHTVAGVTVTYSAKGTQPLSRFRLRLLSRRTKEPLKFAAKGLALTRGGYDVPVDAQGHATVVVSWSK
jgi:hypothetical protein